MKVFLVALGIAFVLFAMPDDEPDAAVPVSAPSQVGRLDTMAPAVPLEVSETAQPVGWEPPPPPMPEEEIAAALGELWDATKWGVGGALLALLILAAIVVGSERSRYQ